MRGRAEASECTEGPFFFQQDVMKQFGHTLCKVAFLQLVLSRHNALEGLADTADCVFAMDSVTAHMGIPFDCVRRPDFLQL